ncbi:hypothetical protein JCM8097_007956 [Rhodosporidiobolus ruineniae]
MALPKLPSSGSIASLALAQHGNQTHRPAVEYVLLAEFDIDQGSVLRHQFPASTGTDEHLLAEHMLPDGAHDRPEDWTVFYLNQVPGLTVDPTLLAKADVKGKGKAVEQDGAGETTTKPAGKDEGGLLYVMSLVRTKKDATVRRGALVKALAVATRNPYIQIFKPILLLALEDYFNNPSISVLANLYHSLNAMDVAALPFLSLDERTVLRTSDRKDLFDEKFLAAAHEVSASTSASAGASVRRTPSALSVAHSVSGTTSESGASALSPPPSAGQHLSDLDPHHDENHAEVLSSSAASPHGFDRSPSLSSLASHARPPSSISPSTVNGSTDDLPSASSDGGHGAHSASRSRANTLSSLNDDQRSTWSATYAPAMPALPAVAPLGGVSGAGRGGAVTPAGGATASQAVRPKDTHWYETKVVYNGLSIPVRIPLATFPNEIGDYSLIKLIQTFSSPSSLVPGPLHPHLHTSGPHTPALIVLFNALVTGQRVVFLGHGQPAGRVAELVLAACALVSGCGSVLHGIEERAFPYTNLANLDNLQNIDGYIAGVCNPAFADRPSWWDVLCNIETGKITVSKDLRSAPAPSAGSTLTGAGSGRGTIGRGAGGEWAPGAGGGVDEFGAMGGGGGGGKEKGGGESQDNVFMEEILNAISAHYGESVIRARFTDYVSRFVRLASRYEEDTTYTTSIGFRSSAFSDGSRGGYGAQPSLGAGITGADEGAVAREAAGSAARIERWMKTDSYKLYQQHFRQFLHDSPVQGFDLTHQLVRLRQSRQLSSVEAKLIFQTLAKNIRTDEQVVALLAQLPSHFGGLLPLAFGFFHPSSEVRHHTLELFDQLSAHPTGRKFVQTLNAFHRSAYSRLSAERQAALALEQEQHRQHRQSRDREATVTPATAMQGGLPPPVPGPPLPAKDW